MKKTLLCLAALAFLLPAGLFAAPSEEEVADALGGVMSVFGLSVMATMFGAQIPDGALTIEPSEDGSKTTFVYKNFPAREFLEGMENMMGQMGGSDDDGEDAQECPFDTMSGTIAAFGDMMGDSGQMDVDVTMKGGKVKTLEMRVRENEKDSFIKANGKRYTNMEKLFESAGFEDGEE